MKLRNLLTTIALFSAFLGLASCGKCKKYCQNGDCQAGNCVCEAFYEGEYCDKEFRDKFIGTFNVQHICNNGITNVTGVISKDPTEITKIRIADFYGSGAEVVGVLSSKTVFSIAEQTAGAYTVRGGGTISLNEDTVKVYYSILNSVPADSCYDFYLRN